MHRISGPLTFGLFFLAFLFWVAKMALETQKDNLESQRFNFQKDFSASYNAQTTSQAAVDNARAKMQEYADKINTVSTHIYHLANGTKIMSTLGACGLAHLGYETAEKVKTLQIASGLLPKEKK
jgi:hypothetical protein